jgi:nucleoside-diphosphate-sugar epimerase
VKLLVTGGAGYIGSIVARLLLSQGHGLVVLGSLMHGGWIGDMFRDLQAQPSVRSVVWFDANKQTDWQLDRLSPAAAAFADGLRGVAR